MTLKDGLPRSVGAKNATGEEQRNNSGENEEMEPKRKQRPVVDVTGDGNSNAVKNNISQEPGMLSQEQTLTTVQYSTLASVVTNNIALEISNAILIKSSYSVVNCNEGM